MKPQRWPDGTAYVEAVQTASNLGDAELSAGTVERRSNGLPKPYSGGFTTTFHVSTPGGGYAARCFTRGNDDLERRYHAIGEFLQFVQNRAFCRAEYLPKGIRVEGRWWPIIKMFWVTGRQLNTEVEARLNDPAGLLALAESFREMVRALGVLGVAHGDLQHGNVIVANNELRLIDYDGIYLPALAGMQASEFGHANYQHPDRKFAPFDGRLDRFSSIVIYTAIVALSADPSLWARFTNDENLLFRASDFTSNGSSELFTRLASNAAASKLATGLEAACRSSFDQIPTLEQVIQGVISVPKPQTTPTPPPPPQAKPQATPQWTPQPQPPLHQAQPTITTQWAPPPIPPVYSAAPPMSLSSIPQQRRRVGIAAPIVMLGLAAILGTAIVLWPHAPQSRPEMADAQDSLPVAQTASPAPASEQPTGTCHNPNEADENGLRAAIAGFHQNVVAHRWQNAAYYEDTSTFQPLETLQNGYGATTESNPTIKGIDGCHVSVGLQFQNDGEPQYCIDIVYSMEYAQERGWIIKDGHSLADKQLC